MHATQARAEIVGIKVDEGSLVVWARGLTMFWALVPVNSTPKKLCEGNYLDEDEECCGKTATGVTKLGQA